VKAYDYDKVGTGLEGMVFGTVKVFEKDFLSKTIVESNADGTRRSCCGGYILP
jgi:hypothetical protein